MPDAEKVNQSKPAVLHEELRQLRLHQAQVNLFLVHFQGRTVLGKTFIEPNRRRRKIAVDQQVRVFMEDSSPAVLSGKVQGDVLAVFAGAGAAMSSVSEKKPCQTDGLSVIERGILAQFLVVAKSNDLQRSCVDAD